MPVKPPPTATLPKEPWADVEDALRDRIEVALEHGDPIPEPPYALGGRPPRMRWRGKPHKPGEATLMETRIHAPIGSAGKVS